MLKDYSWIYDQGLLLIGISGAHIEPGIETKFTDCKAKTVPAILSFQYYIIFIIRIIY